MIVTSPAETPVTTPSTTVAISSLLETHDTFSTSVANVIESPTLTLSSPVISIVFTSCFLTISCKKETSSYQKLINHIIKNGESIERDNYTEYELLIDYYTTLSYRTNLDILSVHRTVRNTTAQSSSITLTINKNNIHIWNAVYFYNENTYVTYLTQKGKIDAKQYTKNSTLIKETETNEGTLNKSEEALEFNNENLKNLLGELEIYLLTIKIGIDLKDLGFINYES